MNLYASCDLRANSKKRVPKEEHGVEYVEASTVLEYTVGASDLRKEEAKES